MWVDPHVKQHAAENQSGPGLGLLAVDYCHVFWVRIKPLDYLLANHEKFAQGRVGVPCRNVVHHLFIEQLRVVRVLAHVPNFVVA